MSLPQGTRVPMLDTNIPLSNGELRVYDSGEGMAVQGVALVRLTHPADIFDEMTRRGCKLNLLTFGYYMEEK